MRKADFDGILQGLSETKAFLAGDEAPVRVHIPADIDAAAIRGKLGFTQTEFAGIVGVAVATLRNWEQGRRVPEGPARVLLALLARNPRIVETTLAPAAIAPKERAAETTPVRVRTVRQSVPRAGDLTRELRGKLERVNELRRKLQLMERDLNDRIRKSASATEGRTKDRAASPRRQRAAAR